MEKEKKAEDDCDCTDNKKEEKKEEKKVEKGCCE